MSRSTCHAPRLLTWLAVLAQAATATRVQAQTDYYNTDAGRPVTVEDAYSTERYAFEFQFAPIRLERVGGGLYNWGIEPEIAYGIFPRTHLEIGLPIAFIDAGPGQRRSGIAGLDISLFHNLNVETSIPALAVAAEVLAPVGSLGPDKAYFSAKGIATRTFRAARFHLNGRYTFGAAPATGGMAELSRWLGGIAVDKTFPLRAMLITAEAFARQPMDASEKLEWNAGAGTRYQLSPAFSVDAGVGKRLTGPEQGWFVTFGLARAFAIRSLMPGR